MLILIKIISKRRNINKRRANRIMISAKGKKGGDDEENKETAQGGDSIIPTLPDVKMCAAKAIARCARNSK